MFEHLSSPCEVRHLFTTSMKCAGCGRRKARELDVMFSAAHERPRHVGSAKHPTNPTTKLNLFAIHAPQPFCLFPSSKSKVQGVRKEATNPCYILTGRKDVSCGYTRMLGWEILSNSAALGNT